MTPYTEGMYQTATYWAPNGSDGFGGATFAAPILITCRFQTVTTLIRSAQGQELATSSIAYTDRKLLEEGYFAEGDHTSVADPRQYADAALILTSNASPSLDATEVLYKVTM